MPCDLLPEAMPMTIFAGDGFHLRVRDGRVLLLWPTPGAAGQPWSVHRWIRTWIAAVLAKAHRRVPALREAQIDRAACWAGLYEMSPDKHAILGAAPGCPNLFLANGSSGHGVMHAPALGAAPRRDHVRRRRDQPRLRRRCGPSRFAEGRPNPVSELL